MSAAGPRCDATYDGNPDWRCTRPAGHGGHHIDAADANWDTLPAEPLAAAELAARAEVAGAIAAALDCGRRLAEVRAIFAAFDWETDDRQYALEAIERAVTPDGDL